jgi:hypothetical protein
MPCFLTHLNIGLAELFMYQPEASCQCQPLVSMTRFQYKGRETEILTTKNGEVWTWTFIVDGVRAAANRNLECCKTQQMAIAKATKMARPI